MKRVAVIAVVLSIGSSAWAGSPFYVQTDAQKRKAVVSYIRSLTGCVADVSLRDPDGAVQYRAGLFTAYVAHQQRSCPAQMDALREAFDATYGDGEAERFIKGPYLADLKRAVLSLIQPQLDAKVEATQREEAAERDAQVPRDAAAREAEAARQKAEDARMQAAVEVAAQAEAARQKAIREDAEKQRFIERALKATDPPFNVGTGDEPLGRPRPPEARASRSGEGDPLDPPPPPTVFEDKPRPRSVQDDLDGYAAAHQTSTAEIVRQTGMSAVDVEEYIQGGEKGGQTPEQVISGLLAMHVPIDQNTSKVVSLGVGDMSKIVDTYKKNEMRFARDFKGRHFEDDISFANARQNLIISGSYTVIFGQGGIGDNLTCETSDPKEINVIADWDKGDRIHVSGEIKDVTFGDVQLTDCMMRPR